MIVDASALVAILIEETGFEKPLSTLRDAPVVRIGAPTLVETGIVLVNKLGVVGRSLVARAADEFELQCVVFAEEHWQAALDAHLRYGKGRHRAALNLGDCLTYAVAKLTGEPLLCLGDDFAQTDLQLA